MNKSDQLYENYEDALFALLMDKVAQEEGARLLEENERLQNDPGAAVPEELERKNREAIRRAFSGRRGRRRHSAGWYLSKLAVAILAALLLFITAYAISPEVRVKTLEMLINASNVSSELSLAPGGSEKDTTQQTLAGYALPNISDNYTVVDQGETRQEAWIEYLHADGSTIRISIKSYKDQYLDSEDAEKAAEIRVHGYEGMLVEKEGAVYISWYDSNREKVIYLYTTNLDQDMTLSYAEQIAFIG